MLDCSREGGRALAGMGTVVGCVYGLELGMAGLFGVAAWLWLAGALDGSLATRTLLTGADANVFIDLAMHHGESLRTLGVTAGVLLFLGALMGIWTNGALVAAAGGAGGMRASLRRGWGLFPLFGRLWMLAVPITVVGVGAMVFGGRALVQWAGGRGLAVPPLAVVLVGGVLAGVLIVVLTTVHDHARIHVAARAGIGALRAYGWAWQFVWRRRAVALPLAAVLGVVAAVVWGCGLGLRHALPTSSASGVAIALVVGQFGALARVLVRGWWFAAETALQRREVGPGR